MIGRSFGWSGGLDKHKPLDLNSWDIKAIGGFPCVIHSLLLAFAPL